MSYGLTRGSSVGAGGAGTARRMARRAVASIARSSAVAPGQLGLGLGLGLGFANPNPNPMAGLGRLASTVRRAAEEAAGQGSRCMWGGQG
jgi:hypothetical protein